VDGVIGFDTQKEQREHGQDSPTASIQELKESRHECLFLAQARRAGGDETAPGIILEERAGLDCLMPPEH